MRMLKRLAIVTTLVALGCGGGGDDDDGNPTGPPGGGGGATNGSFSVQINGATWGATGTINVQRQTQNNIISFAGSGSAGGTTYGVAVSIVNATGPGNHSLNIFAGGDGSNVAIGTSSGVGYSTGLTGGSGTLTITSLTATRIVGTFSGTAVPAGATTANLVLVNGQFDITF